MTDLRPRERPEHSIRGLTDDVLTLAPRAQSARAYLREAIDRLAGADPGLKQLRTALQAVLSISAGVGLAVVFVHLTGALQMSASAGPAAVVSQYNHALLIVSMLLAGMVAMMAGFTVNDSTVKGQVISTLILPLPMIASMSLGLALGGYRVPSLVFLVVLLAVAVYVRRWGPRGFAAGLVAFNGGFLGFFLHKELGIGDIGWLAADLAVGVIASLIVRLVLFRPDPEDTLERMRHSWEARAHRLIVLSIASLEAEDDQHCAALQERLRRQVVRLNESTLMIDAQLAESVPRSAAVEARRLFDAEVAVSNCARFAAALARIGADETVRALSRAALTTVLDESGRAAVDALRQYEAPAERLTLLAHRLAASIDDYSLARGRLYDAITDRLEGRSTMEFTPAVTLNGGFLPGSAPVSTAASQTPGRGGRLDRTALPPYVRAAIQITVAATLAVIVGDIVSGPRLYWAVLATFLAFMATTNSGEQVRKALFRVAGTAVGIVIGDLLVHVTGGHLWSSLLIVLVALFFGIYLIRVNYTFMVIGVTVTMSQLYYQLGEFSWNLLTLRLGETAIGVGAVVLTVLFIVPLRPQRVLTAGVLLWFRALSTVVDGALAHLLGSETAPLRPAIRDLDAAFAAFETTARPLRSSTFGRKSVQLTEIESVSAAARAYARSLAVEAADAGCLDSPELRVAALELKSSMQAIESRVETGEHGTYVRSSALIELALRRLPVGDTPGRLALRDLTLLDGALARLATSLHMDITDHDTTGPEVQPVEPGLS
jgi:uncharacterized membrane protein YgaE (UPF0421/DUF939 family)